MRSLGVLLCVWLAGIAGAAGTTHTVRPGETLWGIARQHNLSVEALMQANRLASPALEAGQVLLIPQTHTVQPGETLWRISRAYGTTVAALKALNGLTSDVIQPGQLLLIPPAPPKPAAARLVQAARRYLGVPYRYGGADPSGMDCSGYVQRVFLDLGIPLPRTTQALWRTLPPARALRPGDLVFFSFQGGAGVDHVGIYLGAGRFVHANTLKGRVVEEPLAAPWNQKAYRGARRVPALP